MAAPMLQCVCHILESRNEPIVALTNVSWKKICECMNVWQSLDGPEKDLAVNFDSAARDNAGYHRSCYQKFTNKKRIEGGVKRREMGCLANEPDKCLVPSPKKAKFFLRSKLTTGEKNVPRRSVHVLPEECIICQKTKTILNKCTMKRKIETLVTCETDGDTLLTAARMKGDDRILLQIADSDPVSIEVRYHASCYKQYTKCVYGLKEKITRPLTETFKKLCTEVIERRIISNGEVLRMDFITSLFVSFAKEVENVDILGYRNDQIKLRLVNKYPFLRYIQPDANSCEFVFHKADNEDTLIHFDKSEHDEHECASETESEGDTETREQSYHEQTILSSVNYCKQEEFAQLYRAAVIIRTAISTSPGVSMWPPSAENFSLSDCMNMVPNALFNFLAWCCGISEEFAVSTVEIGADDNRKKILSLAQDIIYLANQGRKLMPQHLALGMTLRHLTGSAKIQQLINSFGHCVSHSVTLEHDTALATKQLQRESDVPHGFRSGVFTTLVWDNNDFGEETLSGKGTTHNTNGIIIQAASPDMPRQDTTPTMSRDRKRTVADPLSVIEPFHGQKRKGPVQFQGKNPDLTRKQNVQEKSKLIDQALLYAKFSQEDDVLPGWTACNQMLMKDSHPLSNIGYLPVIDASPTDKSTVNAILEKSLDIANCLNLPAIVLVFDQAIYAKAQEIRWYGPKEYRDRLVIRLGEFHTAMAFLGVIGKRFGDAGLKDIIIESSLVAEGSVNGVISGHHYNRSLRCHKILSEALHRLKIQEYLDQLSPGKSQEAITIIQTIHNSFPSTFLDSFETDSVSHFLKDYEDHVKTRCKKNDMYAFWTSYLDMVELLLLFLRATREGNWELHLATIRDMIPWFFAYGRINYSRYLPIYYLEMTDLHSTHPFVHIALLEGKFAVKRHDNHAFGMTACDQVIEQTFNRDSKTRGGLTGITLNKGAVRRWILSHPARAAIANACYNLSSTPSSKSSSSSETPSSSTLRDEQVVKDVVMTVTGFSNPFAAETVNEVVNICSGKVAPENIQSDLSSAFHLGEECFKAFVTERLIHDQKDVFDRLVLPACKTFSDVDKKSAPKTAQVTASLKEHRDLLARLLMIAQEKELDLKEILKYPLCSLPPALANFDGSLAKTTKSVLLHEVEKSLLDPSLTKDVVLNTNTVIIVDAMVLIQRQHQFPETFGEFAASILKQLVSMAKKNSAKRVDFVTDRYNAVSIKQSERQRRAGNGETQVRINRADQKMPKQMKKYLASGNNKEGLLTFLVEEWKKTSRQYFADINLYATQGETCFKFYTSTEEKLVVEVVPELYSDHEEADTRMLLHAFHASQAATEPCDIIICTVDTDVFVLALLVSTLLTARLILLLMIGKQSRKLDLQDMSSKMDENMAEALVGLHTFTGCDSVSAFKGKGKVKALKLMMKSQVYTRAFCELGKSWEMDSTLQRGLERFVCELYGWNDCDDVNSARYNCFRFGRVSDFSLPPNSDSLKLHMMRANYQTKIYRCCHQAKIMAPDPQKNGWQISESQLMVKWSTLPLAPDNVLQNINCSCKKTLCKSNKCSCKRAGFECTDMCRCGTPEACQNRQLVVQDDNDDRESDSD